MVKKEKLIITALIFWVQLSLAQTSINLQWTDWPDTQIKRAREMANTHIKCTKNEKEVIFYCNLVRMNGPLFERTILDQYLNESSLSVDIEYIKSLREDLKQLPIDSFPLFGYDERLYQATLKFATAGGKKGVIGHEGFDERLKEFSATNYCVAENCSYGLKDPLDSFIMLLIDSGVKGVGHRKNLLNPSFEFGTAAFAPHTTYQVNMVMNFACARMEN